MRPTETKKQTTLDVRTFNAQHLTVSRDTTTGSHQISGYAVTFNQPSKPLPFIEYINPAAFDGVDFSEVQLLYAHDYDNILARVDSGTLSLKVDDKGLFFVATMPDTTLGNDTYQNVENGNLKGLSFSAQIDPNGGDNWSRDGQGNVIHTITHFSTLNEISLTSIPAYTETSVQVSRDYKEALNQMAEDDKKQVSSATSTATTNSNSNSSSNKSANTDDTLLTVLNKINDKLDNLSKPAPSTTSRDDEDNDTVDRASSDPNKPKANGANSSAGTQQLSTNESGSGNSPSSSAGTQQLTANTGSSDNSNKKNTQRSVEPSEDTETSAEPEADVVREEKPKQENEGETKMATKLNDNTDVIKRDFANFLKSGKATENIISRADNNIGLSDGSVIIPETILTPEHEQHQFPRLGNLVRTVSVSTTTGKLPVFQTSDDKLDLHTEFSPSTRHAAPEIKPINWDLQTYTGAYAFSQDLLSDSSYNWQSELSGRLTELRDNTDDNLIMGQLTNGVTATNVGSSSTAQDLIQAIKEVLDSKLKPQDSNAASIVMSQSAFYALDKEEDKMGRPLVQPDVTQATGKSILGKTVVVVDDQLFPSAKAGDANIVVAPLQKAIINFRNNEITGQFVDSYDVWYRILGIYLREDVVQARKDLINVITTTTATAKAAGTDH